MPPFSLSPLSPNPPHPRLWSLQQGIFLSIPIPCFLVGPYRVPEFNNNLFSFNNNNSIKWSCNKNNWKKQQQQSKLKNLNNTSQLTKNQNYKTRKKKKRRRRIEASREDTHKSENKKNKFVEMEKIKGTTQHKESMPKKGEAQIM